MAMFPLSRSGSSLVGANDANTEAEAGRQKENPDIESLSLWFHSSQSLASYPPTLVLEPVS